MAEPMHGYGRKPIPHTQLCLSIVHGGQAMYLSICLTTDIIVINKSLLHLFFIRSSRYLILSTSWRTHPRLEYMVFLQGI